jgi:lipoprotein-anchoring transpeptidase ErfK/SrfK
MGQGLHETTTYIHDMWRGSHGCVNLLHEDAKAAFDLLHSGSTVYVYGRRPGTLDRV